MHDTESASWLGSCVIMNVTCCKFNVKILQQAQLCEPIVHNVEVKASIIFLVSFFFCSDDQIKNNFIYYCYKIISKIQIFEYCRYIRKILI